MARCWITMLLRLCVVTALLCTGGCQPETLKPPQGLAPWVNQVSGTNVLLRGVCFVDSTAGYAVGALGVILRTTDGGANWEERHSGTSAELLALDFADSVRGVAVGGTGANVVILFTEDGGDTWLELGHDQQDGYLRSVCFVDAHVAIAVGDDGALFRTDDGGQSWSTQLSGTANHLLSVAFADREHGVAVGIDGTIIRSIDGGVSWTPQQSGTIAWFFGVAFSDASIGIAVGKLGAIYRTNDGGVSWTRQHSGSTSELHAVVFPIRGIGFAVGGRSILRTSDNGVTWARLAGVGGGTFGYYGVDFSDADHGTVVGDGGSIIRTTTGGE